MSNPLQMIGAAMRAEADALRIVSVNIANAETTAYRRQVPVAQAGEIRFDQLIDGATPNADVPAAATVALDLRPGTLKATSESLHVALDGPGFLVLQPSRLPASGDVPADDLWLTRRGDLHVSADGYLASSTGALVLGGQGPIYIGATTPVIAADGSVHVDDQWVDQLRIVDLAEGARVQPVGDGTYRADASAVLEGGLTASVRQGFLETSNVVPVNEILQLMETVRRFEAEQRWARAYDDLLGRAINELGRTS